MEVSSRPFGYGEFRARVQARPAVLAWLEEVTSPWFTAHAAAEAWAIGLREDPAEIARALAGAEPTGRQAECFTMDRGGAPWTLLRGADGATFAWEPEMRVALRARPGAVEILAEVERPYGRLTLLRTLRELASAAATRRGALALHAAAVLAGGGVTLLIGSKGSGKSTLLLHVLRDAGARYVANDRVLVHGAEARGMPTVISLREGTLGLVPGLHEELASGAWHHASTVEEARAHRAAGTVAAGARLRWPPGLSAAQLSALAGVQVAAGGPVERIVFPRVVEGDGAPERFALTPLEADTAARRILDSGLLAGGRSACFLSDVPPADPATLAAAARRLVAGAACYCCRLGPQAYASPAVWDALRAERG